MGEFTALVAAGVLDFEDALKLVRERGRLMKESGELHPGGMAAVAHVWCSAWRSALPRIRR
jgi:[acyl-carrier-protein] S-malonyltransferase